MLLSPPYVACEFRAQQEDRSFVTYDDFAAAAAGARGLWASPKIGIFRKTPVFTAMYSLEGQLHVHIDSRSFSWPGPYRAQRRAYMSRVKSFSVDESAGQLLRFYYTFIDSAHSFPSAEIVDIFYSIAWHTSAPERLFTFIEFWEMNATRGDIASADFQRHLADRTANRMALVTMTTREGNNDFTE